MVSEAELFVHFCGPLSSSLQQSMAILPIMLGLHDGASKRPGLAGVRPGCRISQSTTQTSEPGEPSSLVTAALVTLKRASSPTTRGCSMSLSFVTHSSLALEHDSRGRLFSNVQIPAFWQSNNIRFEQILEYHGARPSSQSLSPPAFQSQSP